MKKNIIYTTFAFSSMLTSSCMESYLGIEQLDLGTTNDAIITVNKVVPKSGALEVHFSLPLGVPNNVQVLASYKNKQGVIVQSKVSRYSNVILVEGFMGTDEVTIELVSIDESGNRSTPILVKDKPLLSPVEIARQSLKVVPAFGGLKLEWLNKNAQPFAIHVLTEDEVQLGVKSLLEDPLKTIYSQDSTKTQVYVRQYNNTEQKFGFVISDKWGNRTDTLVSLITPYKEDIIDFNLIKNVSFFNPVTNTSSVNYDQFGYNQVTRIQNDGAQHSTALTPKTMFNGTTTANDYLAYKFFIQPTGVPTPPRVYLQDVYATVDLGVDLRLSRVQIYPRPSVSYLYARSSVKRFRIWGTDDKNANRSTKFPEGWFLIGEYVGREPANRASITQGETEYFYYNQEYSVADDNVNSVAKPTEVFRYMRLQLMESYNPSETFYTINEFKLFGEVIKKY